MLLICYNVMLKKKLLESQRTRLSEKNGSEKKQYCAVNTLSNLCLSLFCLESLSHNHIFLHAEIYSHISQVVFYKYRGSWHLY